MPSKSLRNIKKALGEFPLFAHLAAPHIDELAAASRCATFHKDQAIYRAGDPAGEMYVLLAGQVKLALSCNRGNEKVIDVLEPGQSFGEAELFGAMPHLAAAVATRPCQVLCIGRDSIYRVMELDPRLALRVMKVLARRQTEMEAELAKRRFYSGSQRVLDYILQQAGPNRDVVGETTITLGVSKQVLASRFDMQPETFSRTLRDLSDAGLIAVDRCQIRLRNTMIARFLDDETLSELSAFTNLRRLPRMGGHGDAGSLPSAASLSRNNRLATSCETINLAGRQQMLSQRLAKSWLMLGRGVLAGRSRQILRQSMAMCDAELKELDVRANDADCAAACADLRAVWPRYRSLLESSPDTTSARELFSVNEAVLEAAQRLTVGFEKAEGTSKGTLVNIAGRERMLSQRAAKLFMFRQMGIQAAKCRSEIRDADEEFSANLARLAAVAPDETDIRTELASVAEQWNLLQSAICARSGADAVATMGRVFTASERLLKRTESTVELYVRRPD